MPFVPLDRSKYYGVEWVCRKNVGTEYKTISILARKDRHIYLQHYNDDLDVVFSCEFGMPENGPWVPFSSIVNFEHVESKVALPGVGTMFARDLIKNSLWQSGQKVTHVIDFGDAPGGRKMYPKDINNSIREV